MSAKTIPVTVYVNGVLSMEPPGAPDRRRRVYP